MVIVKVSEGLLNGEVSDNEYGGTFCSFKGIPYAAPPLGELRFKAPQPPKPWEGTRDAKQFGSISAQHNFLVSPHIPMTGSEDCLYLNVYTPDVNPVNPLPVMVWIHGGGFLWGSGDDDFYGPEFLVSHNVILVTLNYRLEVLGYLSLDTEDIPGNAGMKDQVAALKWVKNNIKNFGGDPENITIFGESAGSASVSFHLISPMSKGLFNKAILQSGTANCFWAQPFEPRERALTLARQLGCYSEDDKELYNFFKNVPAEKLVNIKVPLTKDQRLYDLHFGIVSEKDFGHERFFYGDINDALANKIHEGVEVLMGYTKDEGLMALFNKTLDSAIQDMNATRDYFVPKPIKVEHPLKVQFEVSKKMKEYYFGKDAVTIEKIDDIFRYYNLEMFVYSIVQCAKYYARKNKVHVYKLTCVTARNIIGHMFGFGEVIGNKKIFCHADDLLYLFPMKVANMKLQKGSEEEKCVNRICTMWTNFAKFGNPTPNNGLGVKWEPFTSENKTYLEIGNELKLDSNPEGADMAFWESIFKEYLPKWVA